MLTMSQPHPMTRSLFSSSHNYHQPHQSPLYYTQEVQEPSYYYGLDIVQQPVRARAMGWGAKSDCRRPVDPPPVINFTVKNASNEPVTHEMINNFILHASLIEVLTPDQQQQHQSMPLFTETSVNRLSGTTMVSLTHIRSSSPGRSFFLLNDLSIRQEGKYQLVFNVYEVVNDEASIQHRASITSNVITVYSPKLFPGLDSSSDLIKEIASQGCKVRVRKESSTKRHRKSLSKSSTGSNNSLSSLGPSTKNYSIDKPDLQRPLLLQQPHLLSDTRRPPSPPTYSDNPKFLAEEQVVYNDSIKAEEYDTTAHTLQLQAQTSNSYSDGYYYQPAQTYFDIPSQVLSSISVEYNNMPPTPSYYYERDRASTSSNSPSALSLSPAISTSSGSFTNNSKVNNSTNYIVSQSKVNRSLSFPTMPEMSYLSSSSSSSSSITSHPTLTPPVANQELNYYQPEDQSSPSVAQVQFLNSNNDSVTINDDNEQHNNNALSIPYDYQ